MQSISKKSINRVSGASATIHLNEEIEAMLRIERNLDNLLHTATLQLNNPDQKINFFEKYFKEAKKFI